ncbi:MAG: zinc ribbon domain-containing protein [Ruminococcus sp.]|nr:zinc ribbon domain-containing protein [Ruminococcus sp.]
MFCPKCGKQLEGNERFCGGCGFNFASVTQAQDTQSAAPAPTQSMQPAYTAAPSPAPAPQKKGANPIVVFLITFIIGLAALAVVFLFVYPGYLTDKYDDDGDSSSSVSASERRSSKKDDSSKNKKDDSSKETTASESEADTATETTTTTVTTTEPTTTTAETTTTEETTTEATTTTAPETTTAKKTTTGGKETTKKQTTTTAKKENKDEKAAKEAKEAAKYSTDTRPAFDEFEWCFGQSGLIYEMPSYGEKITNPNGFAGGWKCMIIYNPTNYAGTFIRELDNVYIQVDKDSSYAEVTIDWYWYESDSSEGYNEEDMEDSTLYGSIVNEGIYVTGVGNLSIGTFWKEDDQEYAIGELALQDGTYAYVALTRP